jgi:hypothetical protein
MTGYVRLVQDMSCFDRFVQLMSGYIMLGNV